ncbi:hypothetical protein KJ664_01990 [Patescibacteria group bacterium]|nr:hypothetical protein [Patescibacteria group bacterium]
MSTEDKIWTVLFCCGFSIFAVVMVLACVGRVVPACKIPGGGMTPCISAIWDVIVTAIGTAVIAVFSWIGFRYIQSSVEGGGWLVPPALVVLSTIILLAILATAVSVGIRGICRRIRRSRAERRLEILEVLSSLANLLGLRIYDMGGYCVEIWADNLSALPEQGHRVFWSSSQEAVRGFLIGWRERQWLYVRQESRRIAVDNGPRTVDLPIKKPWAFDLYYRLWKIFRRK